MLKRGTKQQKYYKIWREWGSFRVDSLGGVNEKGTLEQDWRGEGANQGCLCGRTFQAERMAGAKEAGARLVGSSHGPDINVVGTLGAGEGGKKGDEHSKPRERCKAL